METAEFEQLMTNWRSTLSTLNAPLQAWINTPVDIMAPNWFEKLQQRKTPLETDAELRMLFDATTHEMARIYRIANNEQREAIREFLKKMKAVKYFMAIPAVRIRSQADEDVFILALLFESMADLREDTRDVILGIDELCKAGERAGIDVHRHLKEIAALSSDANHHGMGSMRTLLLNRSK
jgi:hypothetical protein